MQGIPIFPDTVAATGLSFPLFDVDCISTTAHRRLSGNSFNQACMTAFMTFVFAFVKRQHGDSDGDAAAAAPHTGRNVGTVGSELVWCNTSGVDSDSGSIHSDLESNSGPTGPSARRAKSKAKAKAKAGKRKRR